MRAYCVKCSLVSARDIRVPKFLKDERNIRKSHIPAQDNCENILHNMPMKVIDYKK